mmetsp:Transcript_44896/g.54953  ORF Transcript_44896/g.54953 Transcript_44896/m.54953 type:complete len:196 (+) Transcript_44896:39-626(+)
MNAAIESFKCEISDACARIIAVAEQEFAHRERTVALREADVERREKILQAKEDSHLLPMTPTPARAGARFSPRLQLQATNEEVKSDYGLSPVLFSSSKSGHEVESFCIPSPTETKEPDFDAVEVGSCHRLKAIFENRNNDMRHPTARRTGGPSQNIAAAASALQAAVAGNNTEGRKPRVTLQDLLRKDEERLSVC